MKKVINIPDDLLPDLEELAAEVGVSVKDAMQNIIINTLERYKKGKGWRVKIVRISGRAPFKIYHTMQDDAILEKLINEWKSQTDSYGIGSLLSFLLSKGYTALDELNFQMRFM